MWDKTTKKFIKRTIDSKTDKGESIKGYPKDIEPNAMKSAINVIIDLLEQLVAK